MVLDTRKVTKQTRITTQIMKKMHCLMNGIRWEECSAEPLIENQSCTFHDVVSSCLIIACMLKEKQQKLILKKPFQF